MIVVNIGTGPIKRHTSNSNSNTDSYCLAQEYTLLTQFYAVRYPSLPNYIALIGGDAFGIDKNCNFKNYR